VRRRDGRVAWIGLHGRGVDGGFIEGVAQDITDRKLSAAHLPDPEDRLQALFELGSIGIANANPQSGRLVRVNARLSDMLGYPANGLVGRRTLSLTHPADRGSQAEGLHRLLRGDATLYERETRLLRFDGRVVWVLLAISLLRDVNHVGRLTIAVVDIDERKRGELASAASEESLRLSCGELEDRLAERSTELAAATEALHREVADRRSAEQRVRDLLGRHVQAIEDERSRISRELHDTLGQHLAALNIGLKMVDDMPGRSAAAGQRLQQLRTVLDRLESEVDRLSYELRPPALDELGLEEALRSYAQQWSGESGIEVDLHTHGLRTGRLPPLVETSLYRVVQEALTNVRKHAGATRAGVIVERRLDELRLVVEDDGCGFDPSGAGPDAGRHWGLRGMAERAMLVAGQIQIESQPGEGTTIYLAIPLRPQEGPGEQES
jgi:PAS domain S-box-containing protein